MLGVVVLTVTVLPQLSGQVTLPAPLWVISIASLAQSSLLLALLGYLFWRYGLESAMIAHALAHVVSYLANLA